MISVSWKDSTVKPNLHPAFDKAVLTDGVWTITYPTASWISKSKKAQRQWADSKIKHLKSFGITGIIND